MTVAQIVVAPRGRFMSMIPHYVLINGQLLGMVKGGEARIAVPPGSYALTLRSLYRFIEATVQVTIGPGQTARVTFGDRERLWNWLFNLDLVLWLLKRVVHVPEPWGTVYEVASNGFFIIWLLRVWLIRKRYFALQVTRESTPLPHA